MGDRVGGSICQPVQAQQQGGGVQCRHLGCASAALGGLDQAGLAQGSGDVINRTAGAIIAKRQSVDQSGQAGHLVSSDHTVNSAFFPIFGLCVQRLSNERHSHA
ncbi:hypothetical protein [Brevundimonas sp.]|uniref:hypothetical protein n=1 Tax=Brevundimonas sp. TaxID=1871086 RepID=UPI001A2AE5E1|nr:hypothetical protein [Brevundimonas sp.]MBJ7484205.1 hypothetical protein [Brevundimonas sp.]